MTLREFGRRAAYLFHGSRNASDLEEEMKLHIQLRAEKLRQQGMAHGVTQREAALAAQRQFGNRMYLNETSSELWKWMSWERLVQDFRHALRSLRKTPAFTVIAVVTLALGLGMNTAVFSVVNAVIIRGLPYQQPDRLISLWEEFSKQGPTQFNSSGSKAGSGGGPRRTTVSVANLLDYRNSRAFTGLAGFSISQKNLTGDAAPERLMGEAVTANYFALLGVEPEQGRVFRPEEDRPAANPVVLITHDFYLRHFGGDSGVLGRSLNLDGHPHTVIGVLPRSFQPLGQFAQPGRVEFFVPAAYTPDLTGPAGHGDHEINVLGRLRPGATVKSAQAELDAISAGLAQRFPDSNQGLRAVIAPLQDDLIRRVTDSLQALLGASGLIVLITCVNVANLLLVRAIARRHETSVRFALGASRLRIVRQFLAESLLVALAGCVAGIVLGRVLMRLLVSAAPQNLPRLDSVTMDWRVFAVATAIATVTGIAFGMIPAWQASRTKPAESLKSSERKTGGRSQVRWRSALTVAEVALSLILLVGAGLMLKDFVQVMGMDLGFQPDHVLAMNIALPDLHYPSPDLRLRFFQQLEERVKGLPGVQSAAFSNRLPMRGGWSTSIVVDDGANTGGDVESQAVSCGYFETLGIPFVRGRLLAAADHTGQPHVAVVNQAFARRFFPQVDPIGRRLKRGPWITIVGIVNDIRRGGKTGQVNPQIYLPAAQTDIYPVRLADFAVRTASDPHQLIHAIQQQVWAIDKNQPVTAVRTMDEIISLSVAERRFQTLLLLLFAAVAVGLAMIGIFGVLSYTVSQRTPELGIRIALGAKPASILALVMKQAGGLIAAGVVVGLGGAFALTRYLQSLLFNVKPNDWWTYAAAVVLLAAISVAASLIPARRGARVDPIIALRYE